MTQMTTSRRRTTTMARNPKFISHLKKIQVDSWAL